MSIKLESAYVSLLEDLCEHEKINLEDNEKVLEFFEKSKNDIEVLQGQIEEYSLEYTPYKFFFILYGIVLKVKSEAEFEEFREGKSIEKIKEVLKNENIIEIQLLKKCFIEKRYENLYKILCDKERKQRIAKSSLDNIVLKFWYILEN